MVEGWTNRISGLFHLFLPYNRFMRRQHSDAANGLLPMRRSPPPPDVSAGQRDQTKRERTSRNPLKALLSRCLLLTSGNRSAIPSALRSALGIFTVCVVPTRTAFHEASTASFPLLARAVSCRRGQHGLRAWACNASVTSAESASPDHERLRHDKCHTDEHRACREASGHARG